MGTVEAPAGMRSGPYWLIRAGPEDVASLVRPDSLNLAALADSRTKLWQRLATFGARDVAVQGSGRFFPSLAFLR